MTRAKDQRASSVVFGSLVAFPVFYALQISAAWIWLPPPWAAIYTVGLPYSGHFAALYAERVGGIVQRSRTWLRFLFRPSLQARLQAEGRAIVEEILRLGREAG
jgi:hypothetical protein